MEHIGNAFANVVVDGIAEGSVSEVIIDDVGSSYEVGDTVLFTANSVDESVAAATAFGFSLQSSLRANVKVRRIGDVCEESSGDRKKTREHFRVNSKTKQKHAQLQCQHHHKHKLHHDERDHTKKP